MQITTHKTTGTGDSAVRKDFDRDLVANAFLRDGLSIDISPEWNGPLALWQVSATVENGNCEASATFKTEKEGRVFIDGLLMLAEAKERARTLYSLIRPASSWTATGPSRHKLLIRSGSFQVVKRAFDRIEGAARIIDGDGMVIESKIA